MEFSSEVKNKNGSVRFVPQVFFAVYDSAEDADYYGFGTLADAVAEVERWLDRGLVEELTNDYGAAWGRVYVCSVDADIVPGLEDDADCDWFLLDLEDDAINYRRIFASWGDHGMTDISR
jgi:hypothetical protein